MEYIVIFVLMIVVCSFFHFTVDAPKIKAKKEAVKASINGYLSDNNVSVSADYVYESDFYANDINYDKGIAYRYIVDGKNKKVHVFEKSGYAHEIPFNQIIGCEILTDSQVTGGVGRAIVGGVLAGDAGAIVGAVTAKKQIMSYSVVVYLENIQTPYLEMDLIKQKTDTKAADYKKAVDFANKVNASIKAIVSWNARH